MVDEPARVDVFFYGLFMDVDLLRSRGLEPGRPRLAWVDDLRLVIGRRATLVPASGERVHGIVMSLAIGELARLYGEPGLEMYEPVTMAVATAGGTILDARCYVLREPPGPGEENAEYAAALRALARRLGLPADYVATIGA